MKFPTLHASTKIILGEDDTYNASLYLTQSEARRLIEHCEHWLSDSNGVESGHYSKVDANIGLLHACYAAGDGGDISRDPWDTRGHKVGHYLKIISDEPVNDVADVELIFSLDGGFDTAGLYNVGPLAKNGIPYWVLRDFALSRVLEDEYPDFISVTEKPMVILDLVSREEDLGRDAVFLLTNDAGGYTYRLRIDSLTWKMEVVSEEMKVIFTVTDIARFQLVLSPQEAIALGNIDLSLLRKHIDVHIKDLAL